jgi:hypothetical protein
MPSESMTEKLETLVTETREKISLDLLAGINGFFSDRDSCDEALEYAHSMFPQPGDKAAVTTAIMVYHNTLMKQVAKQIREG